MQGEKVADRKVSWDRVLAAAAWVAIAALLLAPPHGLLDKADRAAYAVCHRIPERVFVFGGRPLPLCARCSGTYLGTLAGLLVLSARGRSRAGKLPQAKYQVLFLIFVLVWAVDGLNSYMTLFPQLPHLYEPNNVLRLATGTLEGLAIAAFLLPVISISLWTRPDPAASVRDGRDLAWMLFGGAVVIGLVSSEWPALLYPLALISGLMVVVLIGVVNCLLVVMLFRREGEASEWRQVVAPMTIGIALAMGELAAIGWLRAELTARLSLPF